MPNLVEAVIERHTVCQLCGYTPQDALKEPIKDWRVYTYNFFQDGASGEIYIIACLRCRETPFNEAMSIYQYRVKAGLDMNFH